MTLTASQILMMSPESEAKNPLNIGRPSDAVPGDISGIAGCIDAIVGNCVHGWALDRNYPDEILNVEICLDNKPIETIRADMYRDQLKQGGIGDGSHGFTVNLPEALPEKERHRVSATVSKPGHSGVARLHNRAAVRTNALAPGPSDLTALVKRLEQCINDQRGGFREIFRELHALDQFIRNGPQIVPNNETGLVDIATNEVTDAVSAIASQSSEMAQNQTVIHEALETMTTLQNTLNKRLEQFDVITARIDARLEDFQQPPGSEPEIRNDQPGLKRLILLLGCLTAASLATGIIALLT